MRLPSRLIYGFKANDIEDVRKTLETALGVKLKVSRNDDAGIRYRTARDAPIRLLSLFPNYEVDEGGEYFTMDAFKEYPVILRILEYEKNPNIMDTIAGIPDLDAELLDRREEKEIDIKERR